MSIHTLIIGANIAGSLLRRHNLAGQSGQSVFRVKHSTLSLGAKEQSQKTKGTGTMAGPFQLLDQPLETTSGGALPLPMLMSCAQPAMLRRARTAADNRATFFMRASPLLQ
jgi:hypothetical protein